MKQTEAFQEGTGSGWSVTVALLGLICLGLAILMGTNMDELGPANPEALESFGLHASEFTEAASPGVGIYVAGVGGLLLLIGGWLLAGRPKD